MHKCWRKQDVRCRVNLQFINLLNMIYIILYCHNYNALMNRFNLVKLSRFSWFDLVTLFSLGCLVGSIYWFWLFSDTDLVKSVY